MAISHIFVNFFSSDTEEILEKMRSAADVGDGKSWMNLSPWVDEDNLPETSLLLKFFSARGPEIPLATWVPVSPKKPASVGLSHSAGKKAAKQLTDAGLAIPEGWFLKQDHTRRGLIFEIPKEEDLALVLDFMIQASSVLSGVPTDSRWVADIMKQTRKKSG